MALGPGKYDKLATWARQRVGADAIVLIVIGGDQGHGSTVQISSRLGPDVPKLLAGALRVMADELEAEADKLKS